MWEDQRPNALHEHSAENQVTRERSYGIRPEQSFSDRMGERLHSGMEGDKNLDGLHLNCALIKKLKSNNFI